MGQGWYRAKLRTLPLVTYFPMIQRYEASIYMLGWGVPTFDALYSLRSLTRAASGTGGDGNYNVGRYSNPRMDYVVDRIKWRPTWPVRNRLLTEGLQPSNDTVAHPAAQPDHSLGTEEERGCGAPRRQPS